MAASRPGRSASAANASRISAGPAPPKSAGSSGSARRRHGIGREIAYAVTSLTPEQADPDALLALWRAHWLIENRLHWRRDVILREDHSTIRSGASPQVVAALRDAMLHVVKDAPGPLAETRAIFAENRHHAIAAAQRGFL